MLDFLLKLFFHHLYHSFAWVYDWVAWVVSGGAWQKWVASIEPLVTGENILELGFGTGHLQTILTSGHKAVFGIDESNNMARIARRRFRHFYSKNPNLVRARAQWLPFPGARFDTIVSTFPTPYITHNQTIEEIYRVLKPGGVLIILFAAMHHENHWVGRFSNGLFKIFRQRPSDTDAFQLKIENLFLTAGFTPQAQWHSIQSGKLFILKARKPPALS
ncbi:methylase related with ubiquinone/menaquinone biosynthesis [Anaerolinea thermolimosa]|uniref:class I SAM-dependent methyltransferase n=1 Tax=Anaerolinea thermolimosa TaxID=229919 RepID=UPI000782C969|nr:methyltransferase domain-containing protein [Anaerolinea thermolimosa]GAP06740.1 methylase related with ubiquinone/menaquinone biosynthesis [Anaerolinea thermolimosa]